MIQMYPLNLVVSNNDEFSTAYNDNKSSVFMSSQCVTQEKFTSMLAQGAKFDSVISLEKSEELDVSSAGINESVDVELMPKLEQYEISPQKAFMKSFRRYTKLFVVTCLMRVWGS